MQAGSPHCKDCFNFLQGVRAMFKDLSIGSKLTVSFAVVLVLFLALGAVSIIQIERINDSLERMESVYLTNIEATSDINTNAANYRAAELQHILASDNAERKSYDKVMEAESTHVGENVKQFNPQ